MQAPPPVLDELEISDELALLLIRLLDDELMTEEMELLDEAGPLAQGPTSVQCCQGPECVAGLLFCVQ